MEDRLTDLEVKLAFVEKHVADLDDLVRAMHDTLERMQHEVASIAEVVGDGNERGTLLDEKPPHY
ncbi:MAG: SlyX family protein [Proteobacteria bacterium]|nr:SlyX family protein [Pseudomonadota bacterium]